MQVHRFFNSLQPKFTGVSLEKKDSSAKALTLPEEARAYLAKEAGVDKYIGKTMYVTGQEKVQAEALIQQVTDAQHESTQAQESFSEDSIQSAQPVQVKDVVLTQMVQADIKVLMEKNMALSMAKGNLYEQILHWFTINDPHHPLMAKLDSKWKK